MKNRKGSGERRSWLNLKYYPCICLDRLNKTTKKHQSGLPGRGQDSSREPPECISEVFLQWFQQDTEAQKTEWCFSRIPFTDITYECLEHSVWIPFADLYNISTWRMTFQFILLYCYSLQLCMSLKRSSAHAYTVWSVWALFIHHGKKINTHMNRMWNNIDLQFYHSI
jgi:hypothetical protein